MTSATHLAAGAALCRHVRWKPAGLGLAVLSHFALDAIPHLEDPHLLAAWLGPLGERLWPVLNVAPWVVAAGLVAAVWWRFGRQGTGSRGDALYLILGGLLGIALDPLVKAAGPESFLGRVNHGGHCWQAGYDTLREQVDLWPALVAACVVLELATFGVASWLLFRRRRAGAEATAPAGGESGAMVGEATVRPATPQDLDAVADLWEELIEAHRQLDDRLWEPAPDGRETYRRWVEETLTSDDRVLLVAELDGQVVGFTHGVLAGGPPPMRPRVSGMVTDMIVAADCRRRGIGRRLAEAIRDWFCERGAEDLRLSAAVRNPAAVAFWEALGLEPWVVAMWQRLN